MFAGAQSRFPKRAFIRFAITHHHKNPMPRFLITSVQGETNSKRKPMSQAAGRGLYPRHFSILWMSAQNPVGFAELPQLRFRKEAFVRQQHIKRQATMSLAQNEPVAP